MFINCVHCATPVVSLALAFFFLASRKLAPPTVHSCTPTHTHIHRHRRTADDASLLSLLPSPSLDHVLLSGQLSALVSFACCYAPRLAFAAAPSHVLPLPVRCICSCCSCCCCFLYVVISFACLLCVCFFWVEEFQFQEIFKNIPWQ